MRRNDELSFDKETEARKKLDLELEREVMYLNLEEELNHELEEVHQETTNAFA